MRLDLHLFDLSEDKVKHKVACYIDMLPDTFVFHLEAFFDRVSFQTIDDGDYATIIGTEVIEDLYDCYHIELLKSSITAVEYRYDNTFDYWTLLLFTAGVESSIKLRFQTQAEAVEVHRIISRYLRNDKQGILSRIKSIIVDLALAVIIYKAIETILKHIKP